MILEGSLQSSLEVMPFPCAQGRRCPVFAFGRFLGVPKKAPHIEDAYEFIIHFTSSRVQQQMIFATPWLPVRTDGWGDLGPRKEGYEAFFAHSRNIEAPGGDLKKLERALTSAGRMVLFQEAAPVEALLKYGEILEQE